MPHFHRQRLKLPSSWPTPTYASHLFQRSRARERLAGPSTGLASTIKSTGLFLRNQLWVWPVIACLVLGVVGWGIRAVVEDAVKQTLADSLETILEADVEALRIWLAAEKSYVQTVASDKDVALLSKAVIDA